VLAARFDELMDWPSDKETTATTCGKGSRVSALGICNLPVSAGLFTLRLNDTWTSYNIAESLLEHELGHFAGQVFGSGLLHCFVHLSSSDFRKHYVGHRHRSLPPPVMRRLDPSMTRSYIRGN